MYIHYIVQGNSIIINDYYAQVCHYRCKEKKLRNTLNLHPASGIIFKKFISIKFKIYSVYYFNCPSKTILYTPF